MDMMTTHPKTTRPTDSASRKSRGRAAQVAAACRFIDEYDDGIPTLEAVAAHVGLSPYHLQRVFKQAVGLTPRQYGESRRVEKVKDLLRQGDDVAGALYEAGYGSSSRLYEAADATLGMTPATYKKGGAGAWIRYACASCTLGRILVAATPKGVCFVAFDEKDAPLKEALATEFPAAEIEADTDTLRGWLEEVIRRVEGRPAAQELPLDVRATAFQWRVWRALTEIPAGETRTYSQIAAELGNPKAQRAVGRACATNPVSILVPCHRAIREDGGLGGYRWGLTRKARLLEKEGVGEAVSTRRSGRPS